MHRLPVHFAGCLWLMPERTEENCLTDWMDNSRNPFRMTDPTERPLFAVRVLNRSDAGKLSVFHETISLLMWRNRFF